MSNETHAPTTLVKMPNFEQWLIFIKCKTVGTFEIVYYEYLAIIAYQKKNNKILRTFSNAILNADMAEEEEDDNNKVMVLK